MAVKTLYAIASGADNSALLSETSPGAEAYGLGGWTVGTNAPTRYKEMDAGTETGNTGWSTSALPNGSLGAWDRYRTGPHTGRFAAGDWLLSMVVRAQTSGGDQDGAVTVRVHRGSAADGSDAVEITSGIVTGTTVTNLTTAASQTSLATIPLAELTLDGEYLFFEIAWKVTGVGGAATRDVMIRSGTTGTRVVTPNYSPYFEADFEAGDLSEWTEAQETGATADASVTASDPTPVEGGYCGRFALSTGDERAEVYRAIQLVSGDDVYIRWLGKLSPGFPSGGDWQIVWQLHQEGGGSPIVALDVSSGSFEIYSGETGPHWEGPAVDDAWHEFIVRVNHSSNPAVGFIEVWLDGEQQTLVGGGTRINLATLVDASNYPKAGYYRDPDVTGTGVVAVDGYRVGIDFVSEPPTPDPQDGDLEQAVEANSAGDFAPDPGPVASTVDGGEETDTAGEFSPVLDDSQDGTLEQAGETDEGGEATPDSGAVDGDLERGDEVDEGGEFAPDASVVGGTLDTGGEIDTGGTLTPAVPPAVVTGAAIATAVSVTLNGTVDPNGTATMWAFQYVTDDQFQATGWTGAAVMPPDPFGDAGSDNDPISVSTAISGLTPGTLYHYRLLAGNGIILAVGSVETFTTARVPIHVRELPPLRLAHEIRLPNGRPVRWGDDEPDPAMRASGEEWSTTMPGGYEQASAILARKPGLDYGDQKGYADWTIYGAGGEILWQGRLQRSGRDTDRFVSTRPEGVGWQANLEDDKTASFIGIDRDLSRWQGLSAQRQLGLGAGNAYNPLTGAQSVPDTSTGAPLLKLEISGHMPGVSGALAEGWYDAGPGNLIAGLIHGSSSGLNYANASFGLAARGCDTDTGTAATANIGTVSGGTALATAYRAFAAAKRWAHIQWLWSGGAFTGDENERWRAIKQLAVVGDHGLPLYGAAGAEGLLASDLVAYALSRWATKLVYTTGPNGTITPTSWPIPHIAFPTATTAAEIVRQATRFELPDWAVWNNREFHMHPPGARGRRWKFRTGPTKLKETGVDLSRVWNGFLVSFRDVDGSTRIVGPPGSGVDVEDAALQDDDPLNLANQAGIPRIDQLDMGKTSTTAAAIAVGARALELSKLLDRSGSAEIVGHAVDDRGIVHPYHHVKAGDLGCWVDAADTSWRKIVRTSPTRATRSSRIDIDAPPDALDAMLQRLDVDLVRLGAA